MTKIPVFFFLHPVGIGGQRPLNMQSAKLWLRALIDLLPDVAFSAPWFPYADVAADRERGIRDSLVFAERCDGAVATGGEFSRGTSIEWELFGRLKLPRIDLTLPPMPTILTTESFVETRSPGFRQAVTEMFRNASARRVA